MPIYTGVSGIVKELPNLYMGISAVRKSINDGYIGINGSNRPFMGYKASDIAAIVFKPAGLTFYASSVDDPTNFNTILFSVSLLGSKPSESDLRSQYSAAVSASGLALADTDWEINIDNKCIYRSSGFLPGSFSTDFYQKRGIQVLAGRYLGLYLYGYVYIRTIRGEDIYIEKFLQNAYNISDVSATVHVARNVWFYGYYYYSWNLEVFNRASTDSAGAVDEDWIFTKSNIVSSSGSFYIGTFLATGIQSRSSISLPSTWTIDNISMDTDKILIE